MNIKDWMQYGSAIAMILSGITLAFLSFFQNDGDIGDGVLWYVAQALTYAGSVFGVSIYFRTKLGEMHGMGRCMNDTNDRVGSYEENKGEYIEEDGNA